MAIKTIEFKEELGYGYFEDKNGETFLFDYNEKDEEFVFIDEEQNGEDKTEYFKVVEKYYEGDELVKVDVTEIPFTREEAGLL